jgi:hypothetical protein
VKETTVLTTEQPKHSLILNPASKEADSFYDNQENRKYAAFKQLNCEKCNFKQMYLVKSENDEAPVCNNKSPADMSEHLIIKETIDDASAGLSIHDAKRTVQCMLGCTEITQPIRNIKLVGGVPVPVDKIAEKAKAVATEKVLDKAFIGTMAVGAAISFGYTCYGIKEAYFPEQPKKA